jgi:hypothetical protein
MMTAMNGRAETGRNRGIRLLVRRSVLALIVLAISAPFAYFRLFSVFRDYDDEGYMMLTVKHFLDGHALYDAVPTFYGPFYFAVALLFHRFIGIEITNENVRWISLALWLSTACLVAVATWRQTRRASLSAIAYIMTVIHLRTVTSEPGHPQAQCALLLAAAATLATWWNPERPLRIIAPLGAIAACLILIKLNVGVFAAFSLFWAIMIMTEGRLARWASIALSLAAVLLPFLLMWRDLNTTWGLGYAVIVSAGALSLYLSVPTTPRALPAYPFGISVLYFGGFVAAAAIPISVVLATGTSFHGIVDRLLLMTFRLSSAFKIPATFMNQGIAVAVLSLGVAVIFRILSRRPSSRQGVEFAAVVLKTALGTFVLVWNVVGRVDLLMTFATPHLWLILSPTSAQCLRHRAVFARTIIGFLSVLQVLQAYPVAGTQKYIGTFLYLLVASIWMGDVIEWVEQKFGERTIGARAAGSVFPVVASLLVAALGCMDYLTYQGYGRLFPMDRTEAHGLGRIRIDERRVATYRWIVANLSRYADSFQCTTGFNSLYFWTRINPPTKIVVGNTLDLYTEQQQQAIVHALRESPNSCVISHPSLFGQGGSGAQRPSPLLDEIQRAYVSCGEVDKFEFRVRAGRPLPPLFDCARWESPGEEGTGGRRTTASLLLSPAPGLTAHRICIYDTSGGAILADTQPAGKSVLLRVEDSSSREVVLPPSSGQSRELDLSAVRKLSLVFQSLDPSVDHFLVVRVIDRDGKIVRSLPFVK